MKGTTVRTPVLLLGVKKLDTFPNTARALCINEPFCSAVEVFSVVVPAAGEFE
jgi:hypothetical protein